MQSIYIFGIIFSKEEIMQSKKEVGLNFIKKFYTDFICPYCKEKMYFEGESLNVLINILLTLLKKAQSILSYLLKLRKVRFIMKNCSLVEENSLKMDIMRMYTN